MTPQPCPATPEMHPKRDGIIQDLADRYGPDLRVHKRLMLRYKESWRMVLLDVMRKDGGVVFSAYVFDYTKVGPTASDIGDDFVGAGLTVDAHDPTLANKVDAFIFDYVESERMREHKRAKRNRRKF
jgi:hypothetical protein